MGPRDRRPAARPGSRPQPTGAREVALSVIGRVRSTDAYANLLLPQAIARGRLDQREAALATELAYGTLRMLGTLDWVVSLYSTRPVDRVDPTVLDALRLGAYQLLYTNVPDHAAVAETVKLVRPPSAAGFANAVLRQIAKAAASGTIPWPQPEGDLAAYLRIRYAHPAWVVRLWLEEIGPAETEALCEADNRFPGVGIRVNRNRTSPRALASRLGEAGLDPQPGRYASDFLLVRSGGAPAGWPGFEEGWFVVQDEASVLAADALEVEAGDLVVDLCAGPGGKTSRLAERAGRVVAVEVHPERAGLVSQAMARYGLDNVHVVVGDARHVDLPAGADRVLVDAPCSGLGVLRRRPEARWRAKPEDVDHNAGLQLALLRRGFDLLRPGGTLVYAVCTITRAETTGVIEAFLAGEGKAEPGVVLSGVSRSAASPTLQLLPHVHGTDGMFIAKVRKRQ